jgi:dedicator of cytokinesis protein 1
MSEEIPEKLLYKIMKHLQYIMKFIIQSRLLFAKLNDNKDHMLFEASLEDLLSSFVTLIASPKEMLLSQGAILKCLHVIAADLLQVYDPVKLRLAIHV